MRWTDGRRVEEEEVAWKKGQIALGPCGSHGNLDRSSLACDLTFRTLSLRICKLRALSLQLWCVRGKGQQDPSSAPAATSRVHSVSSHPASKLPLQ